MPDEALKTTDDAPCTDCQGSGWNGMTERTCACQPPAPSRHVPASITPALPPGCKILNDGPGREVLVRDDWDECPVFATVAEATAWAWEYANEQS